MVAVVSYFSACDIVDEPYLIKQKPPDTTTPPDTTQIIQKVLLEDYTGHDCVNCPSAAVEAHDLQEIYGEQLIVIAVHAGWFARPIPQEPALAADYTCDAGETWYNFFQTIANPIGLVNRIETAPGSYLVEWGQWGITIGQEVQKEPQAAMTIENDFNHNTRKLETTVTSRFISEQTDQFSLIVVVTQDSIIDGQKNNDPLVGETPLIEDYVFMHMLRGSLNGDWGEMLTTDDPVEIEKDYAHTITYTFPEEWIPEHCHVVAFIYSNQTKTILQVEEAEVIE
jgi:hypothetical protein